MHIIVSGYTSEKGEGIYELPFSVTADRAQVGSARNIAKLGSPTYLQKDGALIFAINRMSNGQGGITAFRQETGQEQLREIDSLVEPGTSPAYIGINRHKKLLYTANYHTGVIAVLAYSDRGYLSLLDQVKQAPDHLGPRPEQADGAHPHFLDQTPAGNLVCCDLGNDRVDFYRFEAGKLKHLARYQNEAGFGDRHLVFSKDGHYFYVVGELSSKVNVVKFDEQNWHFENIATYLTKPRAWREHNGAAAIRMSSDGRFIYISNRGHNSIVVFQVNADHTLKLIQRVSTFGDFPRDFNWTPDEKFVLAANQNSDNATLYRRNKQDGTLTPIQKDIKVPQGTRVLFTA